ncbi:hypothetical protein JCGZ_07826 [Jatropha curcas]|uniref:Expansin-like EG45 domain-containing protein n=1 Tax=Jatropha curcas TaxID=180498 RepID=A0A067KPR0_JATCU|nr:hypothetical protein JCGZ_07826 [Jatropha curcas]
MGLGMQVMLMLSMAARLATISYAAEGTATFYNHYVPSYCYGNANKGVMIAAASDAIWNNGAACGRKYRVRCTGATNNGPPPCKGGSVDVTIVD